MLKRSISCFCFVLMALQLFFGQLAFAQQEWNFTSLTTKNGLSTNTVNVIIQDYKGLLWFGTNDGLNKFDGTNVTVYTHNERDSTSLPANEVISLFEDKSGRLWVGTSGGELVYYDQRHNSFRSYKGNGSIKRNMVGNTRALYEDSFGNIWAGSYGEFKIIDTHLGKVTRIDINKQMAANVNMSVVLSFYEDNSHKMWIGTTGGLLLYDRKTNKFTRYIHDDNNPASLSGDEVRSIAKDTHGHLFFATNNGLNKLMPDRKSFQVFHREGKQSPSILSDLVYAVVALPGHNLWIGTEEGLNIFDCNKSTFVSIKPDKRKSFSLTNKSVRSIYVAQKGIIWLGTYQGGVNKYDPNLPLFNLEHGSPFDPKGLSSGIVTSFAEYKEGKIFIGTDGGGLNLFDRKTGLFDHCEIKSKIDLSGNPLSILTLELDSRKKLWIGTYRNGLFCYDPLTGQYQQYLKGNTKHDLSQNDIFCIKEDSKGLIWIGTNGYGINVLDPKTNNIVRYRNHPQYADELKLPLNGFMRVIAENKNGDMWLGSTGSGIAVYHPRDRSFTVYNKKNSRLWNDGVLSILHDKAGNTWVGTYGGGLNLFDKKTGKFSHLTEDDGLPNGIVYKILEDTKGAIWISTDKGISCIDPKTKKIKNFSRSNGVQDSPFVLGAGMSSTTGELFFGGQEGFNYFLPTALPTHNEIPPVLLTDLKVANNTVVPGEDSPIREQISTAKDIYLLFGQNFSISYVALNYTAPQQNRYSYKLSGFDHDWNYVGKEKTAYYTNLDPGNYVFHVRASNNEGVWNNKTATINIHVLPPVWRTPYAYLAYILIIAGALFYIRRRGIQKIKEQLALEQEKVNAQKLIEQQRREAEQIHELDMQKIKFLTNLSHEFRTPISLILAPADKLLSLPKDPTITGQVKMIRRNARRLLNLVNQLLDFRKMEEQELNLNLSEGDLILFIKEAAESFHDLSDRKKIALFVESSLPGLPARFDHDKIERIIFNLLSNAFKFTNEGGEIRLKMTVRNDDQSHQLLFCVAISDTGIGINPQVHERIFERFFMENKVASILNQGSGIGLAITKEFAQLHGGEITVESKPGQGSTFYLTLPVNETILPFSNEIIAEDAVEEMDIIQPVTDEKNGTTVHDKLATVLLVEDNEEFRYHLKDRLQAYYQIIEATNGKEGWQKALSCHPQLIVSDISMPYMNGIELSQKIKADKRTNHIPIVLLTASNAEEDLLKGLETGVNDYLTKPFNFEVLNAKIKNLLLYNRSLKHAYSRQIQVKGKEIEIQSTDVKLLNTILQYIDDKLNHSELSVEELSRHVGMSRGSLYHKLLELTGLTPIEYIRSVKLDRAAELLEKSDYNVAQIAYMTGFGTPSYFSRLFKSHYHVLPSDYINSKRPNNKVKVTSI